MTLSILGWMCTRHDLGGGSGCCGQAGNGSHPRNESGNDFAIYSRPARRGCNDLLKPHVAQVLVCDPRKNALLKAGNKSDRIDARKLADLLYLNKLNPVYHGETGIRALREVARSYLALTRDTTRVMNRLKALYRSWAIPCAGQRVYAPCYRSNGWPKISEAGVRRRAEIYYQQLDALRSLREQVRRDLLAEGRKHSAMKLLRQIPSIGPIRAVLLIALMQTPHRFRTKRQLWAYCGLALKTSTSGDTEWWRAS